MKKGFSLIELLAVVAIISVLLVVATPTVSNIVNRNDLNQAILTVQQKLTNARQAAISRNKRVELRLYQYEDPQRPGAVNQYRALQIFLINNDNTAEPLERIAYLPGSVVMNSSAQLSPLLNDSSLDKVFNTGDPQIRLPNIDLNYTAKAIQFRADGSANLRDGDNFLAIHRAPAGTEQEQASLDTIPDFAVFQINPVNGTFRVYRP